MERELFPSEANGLNRFSIYCRAQHFERGRLADGGFLWSVAPCDSIN